MPSSARSKPSAKTVDRSALPSPSCPRPGGRGRAPSRRSRRTSSLGVLPVHGDAVGDGAAGEVVVEPVHVAADVGDAGVRRNVSAT